MDSVYTGKTLTQCKGRIRMDDGVFHVLCFRSEQRALQRSEQQVAASEAALQQESMGQSKRVQLQDRIRENPLAFLNGMTQGRSLEGNKEGNKLAGVPEYLPEKREGSDFVSSVRLVIGEREFEGEGRDGQKKKARANAVMAALLRAVSEILGPL